MKFALATSLCREDGGYCTGQEARSASGRLLGSRMSVRPKGEGSSGEKLSLLSPPGHVGFAAMTTPARPWLPIPSPIRRLFTSFPLQTFPPAPLPSSCPQPSDVPRLFIHASSPADLPSWDAQSLKWQVIVLSISPILHFPGVF